MSVAVDLRDWLGAESPVCQAVERYSKDCLNTYKVDARRITEDANGERFAIEGGYARRQLEELIRNGADELGRHDHLSAARHRWHGLAYGSVSRVPTRVPPVLHSRVPTRARQSRRDQPARYRAEPGWGALDAGGAGRRGWESKLAGVR